MTAVLLKQLRTPSALTERRKTFAELSFGVTGRMERTRSGEVSPPLRVEEEGARRAGEKVPVGETTGYHLDLV